MALHVPGTSEDVVLRDRYEAASIANDLLIAIWFLVGSILFFQESTAYAGTWLFVIGSAQLGIRPAIRLARRVHLRRRGGQGGQRHESGDDF